MGMKLNSYIFPELLYLRSLSFAKPCNLFKRSNSEFPEKLLGVKIIWAEIWELGALVAYAPKMF